MSSQPATTGPAGGADDWRDSAACLGAGPAVFYPGSGEPNAEAKAVCHTCSVRVDCLEYALANREEWGIWGGESERGRRRILRQRNGAWGVDGPPGPGIRMAPGTTPPWRPHRSTAQQAARKEREAKATGPPNRTDSTRPAKTSVMEERPVMEETRSASAKPRRRRAS